jgi:mannose/fructose/N-acetylgalactosamine-specific phosphotransferase system component IID
MYLVLIAWFYVALMMAIAEATSPVGSLLGAIFTFLLYGALPIAVVGYIMGSPARRRAIKAQEAAERERANSSEMTSTAPDADGKSPRDALTSVGKQP